MDTHNPGPSMRSRIRKWGNSLALRIPKPLAAETRLGPGTAVELTVREGELVAAPLARLFTLRSLLARVRPDNLHSELDLGRPAGRELW
jgi:antitoxin MazE